MRILDADTIACRFLSFASGSGGVPEVDPAAVDLG
jgi:hypothetical protein